MENHDSILYEKLTRLQWLLHRHQMRGHARKGPMADPMRGQGRVLAMLKLQPEISTKDLSYLLGIRPQSLNELLGKLEKTGYVVREPSEADRRVMMIRLTDKGKDEQQEETGYGDIFDCLDEAEQAALGDYLDRIIAALEAQVTDGDEEDERIAWMHAARSRMGDEQFEHMMRLRGGFGGRNGRDHHGCRHEGHGRESRGYEGRGYESRGYEGHGHDGRDHDDHGHCGGPHGRGDWRDDGRPRGGCDRKRMPDDRRRD